VSEDHEVAVYKSLAPTTQPSTEAFQSATDLEAFEDGYGGSILTVEEAGCLAGLYEFF
jgi:hypothetical protein